MQQLVERELAGKTDVLGESPPKCHFLHHKFHIARAATAKFQRLSAPVMYGTAPPVVLSNGADV
jgi:hypothetical protein